MKTISTLFAVAMIQGCSVPEDSGNTPELEVAFEEPDTKDYNAYTSPAELEYFDANGNRATTGRAMVVLDADGVSWRLGWDGESHPSSSVMVYTTPDCTGSELVVVGAAREAITIPGVDGVWYLPESSFMEPMPAAAWIKNGDACYSSGDARSIYAGMIAVNRMRLDSAGGPPASGFAPPFTLKEP